MLIKLNDLTDDNFCNSSVESNSSVEEVVDLTLESDDKIGSKIGIIPSQPSKLPENAVEKFFYVQRYR